MNQREIEKIIKLIEKTSITEIELEEDGKKIRLKRELALSNRESSVSVETKKTPFVSPAKDEPPKTAEGKTIFSPFVGTFYRSPSPGTSPYVEEGQLVKKGEVICIVEAMKVMNEIEAEFSGKIVSILAKDGEAVEYGEPLFIIKPEE